MKREGEIRRERAFNNKEIHSSNLPHGVEDKIEDSNRNRIS